MVNMIFSNYQKVAVSLIRKRLLYFAEEAVKEVLPEQFLSNAVKYSENILYIKDKQFILRERRIFVIGAGKASAGMALELEKILGVDKITAGIVVSNDRSLKLKKIKIYRVTHPLPSQRSVEGAKAILDLKKRYGINKDDLILALISGGGSSLLSMPVPCVSLADKKELIKILIQSGMNVHKMTILKKKISQIKGGKLAQYFHPTPIVNLILSDVVDNNPMIIASGPLTEDKTTFREAWQIVKKYNLTKRIPPSIISFLKKNRKKKNPKYDFKHVSEFILADNGSALKKIRQLANKNHLKVKIRTRIQGEAKDLAKNLCHYVFRQSIKSPTLYLFGGEMTVTLPKIHGKGGRNQEFVVACLRYLKKRPTKGGWGIISFATDGVDYIKESAGGVIDNRSLDAINKKKLSLEKILREHNSYNLLNSINSNLKIGRSTGTNVCDIIMFYREPN